MNNITLPSGKVLTLKTPKELKEHLDKSDPYVQFDVYVVWQCCILENRKWLISTTLPDGMYYEVTYDYHKGCYYLDAYKKFENRCIWCNEIRK